MNTAADPTLTRRSSRLFCQAEPVAGAHTEPWLHFAPHPETARLYDARLPVYAVTVSEIDPTPESYWGWWDQTEGAFSLVYPWRGGVEMCFPYGTKVEEARGAGRLVAVAISDAELIPRPVAGVTRKR
jgi:hypothetical protein